MFKKNIFRKSNIVLSGMLIAGMLGLTACGSEKKVVDDPIKPVKWSKVIAVGGVQQRTFAGTTQSGNEANLSFRANGLIEMLRVKVGDKVKRGQLLAKLDQKDVRLNFEKAKATLRSAKIQLDTAKSSLERVKQLYMANNTSLTEYERAKNSLASASSGYETAVKALDLQKSQLEYTKIVAPTAGIVTKVNAEKNEFTSAGSPVIVINSGDDMEINVGVPENYISRIRQGDSVDVVVASIKAGKIKGVVTEVGFSSAGSVVFPVIVKVSEKIKALRPGMPAEVAFSFGNETEVVRLVVPVLSVGDSSEGNYIYELVKEADHYVAKKRIIKTGPLLTEGFQVMSGIKEGAIVAVAGLRSLYDGRKVKLLEQKTENK